MLLGSCSLSCEVSTRPPPARAASASLLNASVTLLAATWSVVVSRGATDARALISTTKPRLASVLFCVSAAWATSIRITSPPARTAADRTSAFSAATWKTIVPFTCSGPGRISWLLTMRPSAPFTCSRIAW